MKQFYGISVGAVLFLIFVAFRLIYQNSDYSQDSKFKKNEVEQAIENYIQKETDNASQQQPNSRYFAGRTCQHGGDVGATHAGTRHAIDTGID